jgi:hypothetical protein
MRWTDAGLLPGGTSLTRRIVIFNFPNNMVILESSLPETGNMETPDGEAVGS